MSIHRLVLIIATLLSAASCSSEQELGELEKSEINKIFKTGITHPGDPYVRAETARILEILGDPALSTYAEEGVKDSSPMVRVASTRALLSIEPELGRQAALDVFSRGSVPVKRAVINAAAEYGPEPLRRELTGRALRAGDPALVLLAFEEGHIARVDRALKLDDQKLLERSLYPELGRFITLEEDPVLASRALEKFLEVGQTDRADPIIKALSDEKAPLERRLSAARVLIGAHAAPAEGTFLKLLKEHEEMMADDSLAVPENVIDAKLVRLATLGVVAAGNTEYVPAAQRLFDKAPEAEALEVLDALGKNPSEDAALTLKIAMSDGRRDVRFRAIALYEKRKDADAKALIGALNRSDYETQKRLSRVLRERFRDQWVDSLRSQIQRTSEMKKTLELLRDVVTTALDADLLVVPLRDVLEKIASTEKDDRAALASYLLAISTRGEEGEKLAAERLDEATRYAFLEFLVRTRPEESVDTFRKYFFDDMFVIRLVSAAGLWRTLGDIEESPEQEAAPKADAE